MEIALPAKLEQFVQTQVRAGRYVDAEEVVRDALRRLQEAEAPEVPPGVVADAVNLARQAQRDVLALVQRADRETDVFHQMLGFATHAVDTSFEVARRVPGAREVEKVIRGSLDQVTKTAQRGEAEARQIRQGLEATAKMLGVLAGALERVNGATAAINRVGAP